MIVSSLEGWMNGAQALIRTLAGSGVEVCFSNPGTSEMHFVAAQFRRALAEPGPHLTEALLPAVT
jgi:hypothetical protein